MTPVCRPLDSQAFERLCDQLAAATARCSDEQILDLADSLHATLRRRRDAQITQRLAHEPRSWVT